MAYNVLNPTTLNYRLLPEPLSPHNVDHRLFCFIAFDLSKSCHYKVVHLKHTGCSDEYVTIDIFSSENQSCKELSVLVPADWRFYENRVVFWNGAINWISKENRHIRFIVEVEKFTSVHIRGRGKVGYFGECGHNLHLVKFYDEGVRSFKVFEMNKDTNLWVLKLHLNLNPLLSTFPNMSPRSIQGRLRYSVLSVEHEINKDNFSFVLGIRGKIISYWINMDTSHTMTKVLGNSKTF